MLIADDDPEILTMLSIRLSKKGYKVLEAADGLQTLQMARSQRPDLVLLDVMMPGDLDGFQVCDTLRKEPPFASLPIVMLTARAQAADREAGARAGADDYLVKPFSPAVLVQTVQRLLAARAPQSAR